MKKIKRIDLNEFIDWAEKDENNSVKIHITNGEIEIWVYNYKLKTGQFVESVNEINLIEKKEKEEKMLLEKLKKKYGDVK